MPNEAITTWAEGPFSPRGMAPLMTVDGWIRSSDPQPVSIFFTQAIGLLGD